MNDTERQFKAFAKAAKDFEKRARASWETFNAFTDPQMISFMLQPCGICGGKLLVFKSLDGPWQVGCTKCGCEVYSEHPRMKKVTQHRMRARGSPKAT